MTDIYDNPTLAEDRAKGLGTPEAVRSLGFFESVSLGYKRAGAAPDWGLNQVNYEGKVGNDLFEALKSRGYQLKSFDMQASEVARRRLNYGLASGPGPDQALVAANAFWDALQLERIKDPSFLPDYADVHDWQSLSAAASRRRGQELAKFDVEARGGSTIGGLVGALGHGLTDPTSYIPVGGEVAAGSGVVRQILSVGAREAVANAALTAGTEPLVRIDARRIGVPRTAEDTIDDILMSGAVGGTIGGSAKGLELGAGWLRTIGQGADRAAADTAEAAIPPDIRTPDQQAAINVTRRQGEVADASPFLRDPAGDDAHRAELDGWLDAISNDAPAPASQPKRITRGELLAGTADPTSLRFPSREAFKQRLRHGVESTSDTDTNPRSTASGRYQFTLGTWLSYYKRRYGAGGQTNNQIWAKRFDPNLQEVLMDDLTADHSAALHAAGQPETAGSLYLLHFAGEEGGLKVLRADPALPVKELLSGKAIRSNPFLEKMNAGELVAWADRKMGSTTDAVRGAKGELNASGSVDELPAPPDFGPERFEAQDFTARAELPTELPSLRPELFATPEDHAAAQVALRQERDAAEGFASVIDDPAPPGPAINVPQPAARQRSGPVDVMQAIADAGGLLDNEGHDLVQGRGIPKFELGAGAIIRPEGTAAARGVDAMGEHLWERGYFGPPATTPRPSESQVLDLIERAAREKVYRPEDAELVREREAVKLAAAEEEDARFELAAIAQDQHGVTLDATTLDDALARRAQGASAEQAVQDAMQAGAFRELGPAVEPIEAPGLPEARGFDDPIGEGAQLQSDSMEHDLAMDAEAGGSFRLDANGEDVDLQTVLAELDDDLNAAETMRGCMAPPAAEAAE